MSQNTLQPQHPLLFFITRLFILIGMVLVFMFGMMGVGIILSKYLFGVDAVSNPFIFNQYEESPQILYALKLVQSLYAIGGFLIPALIFPRALQQWSGTFLHSNQKPSWLFMITAVVLMIISTPLISWLIEWNENIKLPTAMADMEQKLIAAQQNAERITKAFIHAESFSGLLLNMLIVAVIPAICEEFLFRGALMRFLMTCFNNKHSAVILTAAVFSLMHGEFYGLIPRFALGILLGYIAWYSGSIWPAVLAHFFNNAIALLAHHYHWNESNISFLSDEYHFPTLTVIISLVATFTLTWWMKTYTHKTTTYNGE